VVRRGRLRDLAVRPHLPKRTVRLRLTALYCALFFPVGVALVAVTSVVTFLSLHPVPVVHEHGHTHGKPIVRLLPGGTHTTTVTPEPLVRLGSLSLDLHEFLLGAIITLVVMFAVSALIGWLLAGRVLRPLRIITDTTQNISEHDLHQRLALPGPRDELTELGDTIDELLGRLERAFDSQRRFVTNASHELRTPLTVDRAMLQVALADPNLTLESLRAACEEVLEAGREQERLIDALLTLARSQRGLDHKEPAATADGLQVDASLSNATVPGDARLLHQLVSNLVDNAVRHNVAGGRVEVRLAAGSAGFNGSSAATLTVTNTGLPVAPDQVNRLLQPFQRGTPDRTANPSGFGLGLSIVADIAEAHGAGLEILPRPEGGLAITVSFPIEPAGRSEEASQPTPS
jgi:signal transduction histidine kinase